MRRDTLILLLIAALYLVVGTIGHDPWRGDDASHFGPIYEVLDVGPTLMPAVAGELATEFGPLFYWLSAAIAAALQWLLPIHDGARLATALFGAGMLFALWRAASLMHGLQARNAVALITIGSLGLVVHVHEIQPAIGLLTAQACVLWALVSRSVLAPVGGGLAASAAFLTAGLQGALMTWPLLLLRPAEAGSNAAQRVVPIFASLAVTMAASLAWVIPASATPAWGPWLAAEIETMTPTTPGLDATLDWFKLFGWFLWPLWPLAVYSIWRSLNGAAIRHIPLLLAAFAMALSAVLLTGGLRSVRMLPLIVPLALLAAPAIERLRRGAAAFFDWFGVMTFSACALLLWLAWSALVLHWPPGLARHFKKLAPAFELSAGVPALVLGSGLVMAWAWYVWRRRSGGRDAALTWATGITMLWCIAASMLEPWFDHNRSYREAARELSAVVAQKPEECVTGLGLGEDQRASMHYFAGLRVPLFSDQSTCALLLVYTDTRMQPRDLSRYGTAELWRYERGGGRQRESFTLLERR